MNRPGSNCKALPTMGDVKETEGTDNREALSWSVLQTLPVEVLLHICQYLDAEFISSTLSKVCRRFGDILSDDNLWRARISRRLCGLRFPAIPVSDGEDFDWKSACVEIETHLKLWNQDQKSMKHAVWKDVHIATVDAVLLLNSGSICVTGSRDRSMAVWSVDAAWETDENALRHTKHDAHDGWIWRMAVFGDSLFSCSWDKTIKMWTLDEAALQRINTFRCGISVLSIVCCQNLLAAGTFSRSVFLFDPRVGSQSVNQYSLHNRAVLALSMKDNVIVSASEDRTLGFWDVRANRQLRENLVLFENREEYPISLSWDHNLLYAGDSKGRVILINTSNSKFEVEETYEVHSKKLTTIKQHVGSLITGSSDGNIQVMSPTHPLKPINVLKPEVLWEIVSLDYQNNVLVAGGSETAVELWMPQKL